MIEPGMLYAIAGVGLFVMGLRATLIQASLLLRLLALNVCGAGVFLIFVAVAFRPEGNPDPIPHALVLTGIVVAVSAMAMAIALGRRLAEMERDDV